MCSWTLHLCFLIHIIINTDSNIRLLFSLNHCPHLPSVLSSWLPSPQFLFPIVCDLYFLLVFLVGVKKKCYLLSRVCIFQIDRELSTKLTWGLPVSTKFIMEWHYRVYKRHSCSCFSTVLRTIRRGHLRSLMCSLICLRAQTCACPIIGKSHRLQ